jgi:hypothetical protein
MIDQFMIGICGATACWLSQDIQRHRQRYACLFGLLAQPFWYYAAYTAQQWGIFLVCIPYTAAWLRGFYNHWIRESI